MSELELDDALTTEEAAPEDAVPEAPEEQPYQPPVDEPEPIVEADDEDDLDVPGPRPETEDEIIEPKTLPVERTISDSGVEGKRGPTSRTYVQRDFLYHQQMAMYGLLARAVNIVLESDIGLGTDDLFDMLQPRKLLADMAAKLPGYADAPDVDSEGDEPEMEDVMKMMSAFAKLIQVAPDILLEFQVIVLNIPKAHREWAINWALPNLEREEGNDIMHTFIDQNWGILETFFTEELPRMFKRAAKARARHRESSGRR